MSKATHIENPQGKCGCKCRNPNCNNNVRMSKQAKIKQRLEQKLKLEQPEEDKPDPTFDEILASATNRVKHFLLAKNNYRPSHLNLNDACMALLDICLYGRNSIILKAEDKLMYLLDNYPGLDRALKQSAFLGAVKHAGTRSTPGIVKILLTNPNAKINVNYIHHNEGNFTALMYACLYSHDISCDECVQLLLDHGADVNLGNDKATPLIIAASESGSSSGISTVKLLLNCKANIHKRNKDEETAFLSACSFYGSRSNIETIELLLQKGADVNVRSQGRTALMIACGMGEGHADDALVKLLLKYNADVNLQNRNGSTPLMIALGMADHCVEQTGKKCEYIVSKLLLKQPGINLELVNKKGLNAYDIATDKSLFDEHGYGKSAMLEVD